MSENKASNQSLDRDPPPQKVLSKENIRKTRVNMGLLLSGQLISQFGSSIYSFAVSLYILQTTGSGLNFSFSLVLSTLPRVLLGPVAGVIADRFDRKKLVVGLDILSGVLVLLLLSVSLIDAPRLFYLYTTTFFLSIFSTFYNVALGAATPNLVDESHLTQINSLEQAVYSMSGIAGPFLGGLCFAFMDIKIFFLVNGLSFVLCGIAAIFIDFRWADKLSGKLTLINNTQESNDPSELKSNNSSKKLNFADFINDLKDGLLYMKSERWLLIFSGFCILFNFFIMVGLTIPMPYIVNTLWHFTPNQYGMLNMTFPIGMLVASILLSFLPQPKSMFKQIIICISIFSGIIVLVGIITSELFYKGSNEVYLVLLMTCYFILAIASMMINIPIGVALQKLVPDEKRGRVQGTLGTLSQGLAPIGAIVAGVLVDVISPWILPIICGFIMSLLAVLMAKEETLQGI